MLSKLSGIVTNVIKPIGEVVDNIHTSKEEKMLVEKELEKIKNDLVLAVLDFNKEELESKKEVLVAEAKSENFITSSWRPITALVFTFIIANNYIIAPYSEALFGIKVMFDIPPQMWELLKLMIGGYVLSRGVEKTTEKLKNKKL